MASCGASLFGQSSQYIKVTGGDFIAIEGSNTRERLTVSDLRMPYKQLLKSRVILRVGQVNYLLNHLGLGDNATFLAIKTIFNPKSVIEADNYINYSFYDDLTKVYTFSQMMVLTGNSTNRIKQLYLTNPNSKYDVQLEVMIGIIDDNYSFFNDTLNQSGTSFTGLEYTDIHSYIVGESIVINDKSVPAKPLIYITLNNIQSIERTGNILIIDDSSLGTIFLQFLTINDAAQAQSLLNYVLENPNIDIDNPPIIEDIIDPILYFYSNVGASASLDYIAFNGATNSSGFDTEDGFTFSTTISLTQSGTTSGTYSVFTKDQLIYLLVDYIEDNRDGLMGIQSSNLIITGTAGVVNSIVQSGTYSLTFDFSDIAQNYLDGVFVDLNIIN
jgi:hypothetical protein